MDTMDACRAEPLTRVNLQIRADQRAAIEQLAAAGDLHKGQVVRRLLDLGFASWSERPELEEVAGRAS